MKPHLWSAARSWSSHGNAEFLSWQKPIMNLRRRVVRLQHALFVIHQTSTSAAGGFPSRHASSLNSADNYSKFPISETHDHYLLWYNEFFIFKDQTWGSICKPSPADDSEANTRPWNSNILLSQVNASLWLISAQSCFNMDPENIEIAARNSCLPLLAMTATALM